MSSVTEVDTSSTTNKFAYLDDGLQPQKEIDALIEDELKNVPKELGQFGLFSSMLKGTCWILKKMGVNVCQTVLCWIRRVWIMIWSTLAAVGMGIGAWQFAVQFKIQPKSIKKLVGWGFAMGGGLIVAIVEIVFHVKWVKRGIKAGLWSSRC